MDPQALLAKRKEFMLPTVAHLYERPMNLVRGEMQFLFDSTGKQYLDFFAGICTVSVGHSNPKVNQRVKDQIDKLQHTSTVFLTEPMVSLAERLAQITPGDLKRSVITNSGTEANEYAVLLAKRYTKSNEIIALKHAYHGRSWLAASLTALSSYRVDPMPVPGISFAENPYCYRCPFGQDPGHCGLECANDLEKTIQTQTTGSPAVFIAETIQGVGGIITPPNGYFQRVREITKKYGTLLHIDEVQAGFGRTGDKWFGIEHWGVTPDIMTMAKGMGNGYAIGGCITTDAVADSLKAGTINTFGGNPVSAEASLATIDYMESESLLTRATELGNFLIDGLKAIQEGVAIVGEVRGKGLMIGVELVKDRKTKEPAMEEAKRVLELMKDDGVIIGRGGIFGNVLRLQPPMVITKADCEHLLKSLKTALETVNKQVAAV
jgi:4-aminobutyrate aminotransferase/4-aminobutyrate aminotransferase/(S)-3-amino-2-methylpropionate transaminase